VQTIALDGTSTQANHIWLSKLRILNNADLDPVWSSLPASLLMPWRFRDSAEDFDALQVKAPFEHGSLLNTRTRLADGAGVKAV
jgi:hypothetical protein